MEELFGQIAIAAQNGLYWLALAGALVIPDMCGALDSEDAIAHGHQYIAWFDKFVAPRYEGFLDGATCYRFRCSLLHQGSTAPNKEGKWNRWIFLEGAPGMHCNGLGDALQVDIPTFCGDVVRGANEWLEEVKDTDRFQRNYSAFMRRYPNGLPPYVGGAAVIS
jgi:hypothetical protein